jgi:hypothetical protein
MNPLVFLFTPDRLKVWSVLVFTALIASASITSAQTYSIDDGTAETSVGYGPATSNSGAIILNSFPVNPAFNTITSVSIAWGAPSNTSGNAPMNGLPMQALLYSDPNGDGSALDGVLLASVAGIIQSAGTNTFITYTFSSAIAITTANFFVGFYLPGFNQGTERFPFAFDETAPTFANRSFIFAHTDGSEPSVTNLASDNFRGPIEAFGLSGNWLIRANGINLSTVPDTGSTLALLVCASAGLVLFQRKHLRKANAS